jgi:hypothetical protein
MMAAIAGRRTLGYTTCTTYATSGYYSSTDTDTSYLSDYGEYVKTDVEEKINKQIRKEELQIPSFKVIKKLNNMMKVKTFVENRQLNFHIRNAL